MTATNLLKAKIKECGFTQAKVADLLGLSYQSFSYKLNNRVDFKASEIETLCTVLNIHNKDSYFFCSLISQNG